MDIRLPELGEGVDSGTVVNIFVSEGDQVKKDQALLELETEKAVASIPSPAAGTVIKIHVKQDEQITVGQAIVSLSEVSKGETVEKPPVKPPQEPPIQKEAATPPAPSATPPAASPSIRKMARDLGIDLTRVRGSQRGGRIVLEDLTSYIQYLQKTVFEKPKEPPTEERPKAAEIIDFSKWGPVRYEPLTPIRRTIGRKMMESWSMIPHVTQFDEADITGPMQLKEENEASFKAKGGRLTMTTFVLDAVVAALKQYPAFNSSLDESQGRVVYKDYIHLGIAVDTDQGLMVPVIKDAGKKSPLQISIELIGLAEKARTRKISLEEMQGGTFTISNQGSLGGGHFTPLIYAPQAAILGIGRAKGNRLPLSLSYDHRIIDGAGAVRFLSYMVRHLEIFGKERLLRGDKP